MLNIGKRKTIALIFAFLGVFFEYSKAGKRKGLAIQFSDLNYCHLRMLFRSKVI